MDPYLFSLTLGGAGLVAMAVGGLSHGHGDAAHGHAHAHGHGDAGHLHAGDGHGGHAHAGHAHAGHHGHPSTSSGQAAHQDGHGARHALGNFLSPRVIFSVLVGLGATGLLLRGVLGGALLLGVAILGGLLFEKAIVGPLWNFFFRFASAPALTLESCIEDEAQVVSAFDATGHGLVAVELDGQVVQLLATLRREDRQAGLRPRMGERVRIEDVDAARNRCTVRPLD